MTTLKFGPTYKRRTTMIKAKHMAEIQEEFRKRREEQEQRRQKKRRPWCVAWSDRSMLVHAMSWIFLLFAVFCGVAFPLLHWSIALYRGQLIYSVDESMRDQAINKTQAIINETIVQSALQFRLQEELVRKSSDLFRDMLEIPANAPSPHPIDWNQ